MAVGLLQQFECLSPFFASHAAQWGITDVDVIQWLWQSHILDYDGSWRCFRFCYRLRYWSTDSSDLTPDAQYLWHCEGLRADGAGHLLVQRTKTFPLVDIQLGGLIRQRRLHQSTSTRNGKESQIQSDCILKMLLTNISC